MFYFGPDWKVKRIWPDGQGSAAYAELAVNGDEDWYEFRPTLTSTYQIKILFDQIQSLANGRPGLPGGSGRSGTADRLGG